MTNETWLQKNLREVAGRVEYETERLLIGINDQIVEQMNNRDLSRTQLAEKLGVDRAYVTRLLNGRPNVTVKTLVSVASALGCRFSVPTLTGIEQLEQRQSRGVIVKFDRPVTEIMIRAAAEALRPSAVTLEVDSDDAAPAAA